MGCASSSPADEPKKEQGQDKKGAKYAVKEEPAKPAPAAQQPAAAPAQAAAPKPSPPPGPKPAVPQPRASPHDTVPPLKSAPPASVATLPPQTVVQPLSKLRTDAKIRDVYKLGKTIGTGGFSVVRLAQDKQTGTEYACKIMPLPPVGQVVRDDENTREDIFKEIDILCQMNHENVIYLKEYFEEGDKVYLITEMLTGGELLDAVLQRGSYNEAEARMCFVQLLRGIEYLHNRRVVHRDLKLENLLLAVPGDISRVKIADFGLAKKVQGTGAAGMQTICGTPQYVAPEVIAGHKGNKYGPEVDMWSAGVVLFILLGGYPPFWSESEPALFDLIRKGKFSFNDPVWQGVTAGAKELISQLLVVDPSKRLTAAQALKHPWVLRGMADTSDKGEKAPPAPVLAGTQDNLKKHFPRRKFKAIVGSVIALNRMSNMATTNDAKSRRNSTGSIPSSDEMAKIMQVAKQLEAKAKQMEEAGASNASSGGRGSREEARK